MREIVLLVAAAIALWAIVVARRAAAGRRRLREFAAEQVLKARNAEIEKRRAFLEHASRVLASSPDYESTLAALARTAIPQVADWCVIDLLREDGTVETGAIAHVDPEKVRLMRELRATYPVDPKAERGIGAVLRTGQSEVYPEVSDAMLRAAARDTEQLRIALALGITSAIAVPLLIGGRRLGVMSLMIGDSNRRFAAADLPFAEDLARRVAVGIDSTRP